MDKIKILCIIGASGSGKTTVEKTLSECWPNVFSRIISHTTRPMREGEHNGDEHIFNLQSYGQSIVEKHAEGLLASTKYGAHYYWAEVADLVGNKVNTYVIDVEGYHDLMHKWGDKYDILVLYVKRANRGDIDKKRMERDEGRQQLSPDEIDFVFSNNSDNFGCFHPTLQTLTPLIVSAFMLPHLTNNWVDDIIKQTKLFDKILGE